MMSIGTSGRIVIEIDPELKQELHELLRLKGLTMKEWFVINAEELIEEYARQHARPKPPRRSPSR